MKNTKLKTQKWITRGSGDDRRVRLLDGTWATPKELLLLALAKIKAEPASYRQTTTCFKEGCRTVACIGGWMWMLVTGRSDVSRGTFVRGPMNNVSIFIHGSPLWPWLFNASLDDRTSEWGQNFTEMLRAAKTARGRAKVAAAAVKYYIASEGLV